MRVLLISYYFPPAGGGGVQRPLGWCRHLPEHDIDVTVVAPAEPHWLDVDPTLVVPPGTSVLRTPDPSPSAVLPTVELARTRGPLSRTVRRLALQPRRFALPDIHRRWARPAVDAVLRAHASGARWDVIVSTSPPETAHLVAARLAQQLDIPWVADFRDSWLDLPHLRLDRASVRWKHRRQVRLATNVLRYATTATTVSEPLAVDLCVRHPQLDVHVLENGVELEAVQRAATRADGFRDRDRFVVTYTGNFFGQQSPATLLEAVERAAAHEPGLVDDLVLRFVGNMKPQNQARIDASHVLTHVVDRIEFLRHDDVLAQQAAADLLFLYVAPGRGSQGVYTGKVFEYVASRRPVLALIPTDNVSTDLLQDAGSTASGTGGACVVPDDVDGAVGALLAAWHAWCDGGGQLADVDVPAEILDRIDRRTGSAQLAQLLRSVVGNR